MRDNKEINSKIKILKGSLEDFAGEDEYTAARVGKLNALRWVLGLEGELTTATWGA